MNTANHNDCGLFFDDPYLPPLSLAERADAIAAELRKCRPSKRFCRLLAAIIDGERGFIRFRFKIDHERGRLPNSKKRRAAAIVARLRKGSPSKKFCGELASMIDGSVKGTEVRFKIVDNYESSGRPAKSSAWRGARVMEAVADGERQKNAVLDVAGNLKVKPRTVQYGLEDWQEEEETRRETRRRMEKLSSDPELLPWPDGLEDEIKRKEMLE